MNWKNDDELFALMKAELFPAVVGDVLDKLGYQHQFLAPHFRPLAQTMVVVGRAMPVLEADYPSSAEGVGNGPLADKPFGLMFEALDSLRPNEVYITCGSSPSYAQWGGLMSTRAKHLHAAGAVIHGYSRDTREILKMDFPVFSFGGYGQDQGVRGKVIDYRIPIEIDGIRVRPGDIVFADRDGVLIIPQEQEQLAVAQALEKVRTENRVAKAIAEGMSSVAAFEHFGVM